MPTAGERIRDARLRKGWTQAELADRIGSSASTVKAWEKRPFPPVRSRYTAALERELGIVMYDDESDDVSPDAAAAGADDPPLSQASDVEFLAEFARRLAKARGPLHDQSNVQPFGIKGMTFGENRNVQGTDGSA